MITVVSQRAHHADNEAPGTSGLRASASSIVTMLPEDSGVFFVDADHVLDCNCLTAVADIRPGLSSDQILSPYVQTLTDQVVNLP